MAGYVWEKSYPTGVKWDIEIPRKGLHEILIESAATYGDKPLLDFFDKVLSFRQIDRLSSQAAHGFQKLGVKPGVHVGLDPVPGDTAQLPGTRGAAGHEPGLQQLVAGAEGTQDPLLLLEHGLVRPDR